jgi:beta-phosphoglucomutase-like phosphatase (HAD superfamily)
VPLPEGLDPSRIEGVFVDLDGTVVHHAELLPTAIDRTHVHLGLPLR